MPSGGENLRAHLILKYGITTEASVEARTRLLQLGEELGFAFKYSDETRIFNTLKTHQLLHFARKYQKEHVLKLRFFKAYFTELKVLDNDEVLVEIAVSVGLAEAEIRQVLKEDLYRDEVKAEIFFYMEQGLRGVPAFIFDQKYLVSGAQDIEMFKNILEKVSSENLSAVE
jgi:predicted DsbA family dithiol-disulfide isomerase